MTSQNQLFVGVLSAAEFNIAVSKIKIKDKSHKIAYDVIVDGTTIPNAAKKYNVSVQWVTAVCKRVISRKDDEAVRFSVEVPAPILSQAKQLINGLTTAYQLGQSQQRGVK